MHGPCRDDTHKCASTRSPLRVKKGANFQRKRVRLNPNVSRCDRVGAQSLVNLKVVEDLVLIMGGEWVVVARSVASDGGVFRCNFMCDRACSGRFHGGTLMCCPFLPQGHFPVRGPPRPHSTCADSNLGNHLPRRPCDSSVKARLRQSVLPPHRTPALQPSPTQPLGFHLLMGSLR